MKAALTEYEREQLGMAEQIIGELNTNLAGRGAGFRFAVTLAGKGAVPADLDVILAVAGDEPCG